MFNLFNKKVKLHSCPCCHTRNVFDTGDYAICKVCNWENDPIQLKDPDYTGGANKMSLNQSRLKFKSKSQTKDFYCDFVLNNELTVEKVRETDRVLAYYHTKPNWTVHIVIIPKQHVTRLVELEDMSVIQEIFEVAQDIIKEKGFAESNYKIITNGGSFQDSQHLHFHLVSGEVKQPFNE